MANEFQKPTSRGGYCWQIALLRSLRAC